MGLVHHRQTVVAMMHGSLAAVASESGALRETLNGGQNVIAMKMKGSVASRPEIHLTTAVEVRQKENAVITGTEVIKYLYLARLSEEYHLKTFSVVA